MRRDDYIYKVKAKLEEISPFDEPDSFIAAGDDNQGLVKPITSYIEDSLDEAARFCLNILPLSLLAADIEQEDILVKVDRKGVGRTVEPIDEHVRFIRLSVPEMWERDVTTFIGTSGLLYEEQQNKYKRGGSCKPVVAYNPADACLELYSFDSDLCEKQVDASLWSIYLTEVKAEEVGSDISEYIVLRCAAMVADILNNASAETFMTEFNNLLAPILK